MAYGELVGQLRVDLTKFNQDLETAKKRLTETIRQMEQQTVRLHTSAARAVGGGAARDPLGFSHIGAQGSTSQADRAAESAERRFRRIMVAGEQDLRKFYASWNQAIKENEQRDLRAAQSVQQARLNDQKTILLLKKGLADDDERRSKEAIARGKAEAASRLADLKQVIALEKHLAGEQRAEAASRVADLKQIIAFEKYLAEEQKKADDALIARRKAILQQGSVSFQGSLRNDTLSRQAVAAAEKEFDSIAQQAMAENRGLFSAAFGGSFEKGSERAIAATKRLGSALTDLNKRNFEGLKQSAEGLGNFLKIATGTTIIGGFAALTKLAFDQSKFYEVSKITIAEILSLTTDLQDKQGKSASATKQQAINYKEAASLIVKIRDEARKTILTTEELTHVFSQAAGFAFAGSRQLAQNPERAVELVNRIAALGKSLGARGEREMGFEVRALLTGQMLSRSRIGRVLGISKSDIDDAKEAGNLLGFLTEKLKQGQPYLDRYMVSWEGLATTLESRGREFVRLSFEKVFEKLRGSLKSLSDLVSERHISEWAERFSQGLVDAYNAVERFINSDGFKTLQGFFTFLVQNSDVLLKVFLGFKALQIGSGVAGAFQSLGSAGAVAGPLTAGLGGIAIGELINRAFIGRNERAAATTDAETRRMFNRRTPAQQNLQRAMGLVLARRQNLEETMTAARGRAFQRANAEGLGVGMIPQLISGDDQAAINARKRSLDQAVTMQREAEDKLAQEHIKHQLDAANRVALLRKSRRAQESAENNKERLEALKQIDDLLHHQEHAFRVEAELAKLKASEDIHDEKLRAQVIIAINKDMVEKIHELRETEALAVKRAQAEAVNSRKQLLDVEFQEAVLNIKKEHHERDVEQKLIAAAAVKASYEARNSDFEALEATRKFRVETTNDALAEIRLQHNEHLKARQLEIEAEYQGARKVVEINKAKSAELIALNRDVNEKIHEFQEKALDLARQATDEQDKQHKARIRMEREVFEAQAKFAKETKSLLKERIQAERDLQRAQEDRVRRLREIGSGAQMPTFRGNMLGNSRFIVGPNGRLLNTANIPLRPQFMQSAGGQLIPELNSPLSQVGFTGVQRGLQEQATALFQSAGLEQQLTHAFSQQTANPHLAAAQAESTLLQFRDQALQSGGSESILGRLRELGVSTPSFLKEGLQGIEARGITVANEQAESQRQDQMDDLKRQRDDIQKAVEDAQQRLTELDEKQAEVLQSYKDTISTLHDEFNTQVRDSAESLAKLAHEANELANQMRSSHIPIPHPAAQALGAVSRFSPAAARAQAEATFGTVGATLPATPTVAGSGNNFVFQDGSIRIDATDPKDFMQKLSAHMQDLSRRTQAARR